MKQRVITLVASLFVASSTFAVAATRAPLSTPELKTTIASHGKPTLIFFLNPAGAPCQAQKAVIDKLVAQKRPQFNLANVSVMNEGDRQAFYDYGVRSLPSLVLVDKAGNITKVFAPGIQDAESIITALNELK